MALKSVSGLLKKAWRGGGGGIVPAASAPITGMTSPDAEIANAVAICLTFRISPRPLPSSWTMVLMGVAITRNDVRKELALSCHRNDPIALSLALTIRGFHTK